MLISSWKSVDIITCIKTTFAQNIDKLIANWISRVKQLIHNHIFVEKKKEEGGEEDEE